MPHPHLRRWGRKSAILAVGFSVSGLFVIISTLDSFRKGDDSSGKPPVVYDSHLVDLTLLRNARDRGAGIYRNFSSRFSFFFDFWYLLYMNLKSHCNWKKKKREKKTFVLTNCCCSCLGVVCLDGSSPGYHFQKGFGSGSNNWLLHIEVTP